MQKGFKFLLSHAPFRHLRRPWILLVHWRRSRDVRITMAEPEAAAEIESGSRGGGCLADFWLTACKSLEWWYLKTRRAIRGG